MAADENRAGPPASDSPRPGREGEVEPVFAADGVAGPTEGRTDGVGEAVRIVPGFRDPAVARALNEAKRLKRERLAAQAVRREPLVARYQRLVAAGDDAAAAGLFAEDLWRVAALAVDRLYELLQDEGAGARELGPALRTALQLGGLLRERAQPAPADGGAGVHDELVERYARVGYALPYGSP